MYAIRSYYALSVSAVTPPANGSVLNNGTNVTYTPNGGFSGSDTFTYTATDGTAVSNSATVTVTVQPPPNQAPVANPDTATTPQGVAVIINVLANDTDADVGDTLSVSAVTQPTNGRITSYNVCYTKLLRISLSTRANMTFEDRYR